MDNPALSILILDDEPFMLKLLTRMLANLGYTQVASCASGTEALKRLEAPDGHPEVILCDLQMPGMDGVQFVRQLVERGYAGSLVLVSGAEDRLLQSVEQLARAHRLTVLGRLNKPVQPDSLAAKLRRWSPPVATPGPARHKEYGAEELSRAIANGQLENHYQPKVDLATGEVAGVETLVRWQHPEDGIVYPDRFIAMAEEHHLIDSLTQAVLTNAIRQAGRWRTTGLPLRVAINVSIDNLNSLDFADFVARETKAAGVEPEGVVLEVTESRLIKDLRSPLETLTRLSLMRFCLSIDDFGTGYSSLAQLREIPFKELKIDQSFVHSAWNDGTLQAICQASLCLARQLGLSVVAEGVEDQDDWEFLRRNQCGYAQGYFIARPMPAAEIPAWIEGWYRRVPELLASPA